MDALPQPPPISGVLDVGNPEDYAGFGEPRHVTLSQFYATPADVEKLDEVLHADTSGWKKHRKEVARRKTRERMAELERIRKQHTERSTAR